jgi:hypothetical protein
MRIAERGTPHGLRRGAVFCLLSSVLCTLAADGPLNPDDPNYLRRQYAWFQKQDPSRQQQLRRLHAEFTQLPLEEQAHLTRVMQAYNAWLAKLPDADRQRVFAAPTAADRLDEIRKLRERDWVDTLPKPFRDEYATLDPDGRHEKVQQWRTEDAERHEEWALAQRNWAENPPGKIPPIFQGDSRPLEEFVAHLSENLTDGEKRSLEEARAEVPNGNYFAYPRQIVRLADQHPIFPWKEVGPKDWKSLPDEVKESLGKQDPAHFDKIENLPKELRKAQGRWPEFAAELVAYCKGHDLALPNQFGAARKSEMPAEVIPAINLIEAQLRKQGEAGKAELKTLEDAQGKWPDYPKLVMELARRDKSPIPGWTLPGQSGFWDRHRLRAGPKK